MRLIVITLKKLILSICIVILASILIVGSLFSIKQSMAQIPEKKVPIYCVDRDDKKIAISFDAAWGQTYTEDILKTLEKYNVKSTFFLVGFWVDKYPDLVKKIYGQGHEIGNHSSTHPKMSTLSDAKIKEELESTSEKIQKITGKKPIVFRPPFGDYDNDMLRVCSDLGYYTIQWDVDSLDWKEIGVEHVVDKVVKNVKSGSIVLFHNNAKYITGYLPLIIEKLQEEGYKIVPVSELIYKKDYLIDSTGKQKKINKQ